MCLYALCSVNQQQSSFTGSKRPAHFIAKIHVTGGVNKIKYIFLPVGVLVINLDGVALDSDAFFSFEVHIVQHLVHHFPVGDGIGCLQKTICQGAFTMVNMRDDTKIPDMLHERFPSFLGCAKVSVYLFNHCNPEALSVIHAEEIYPCRKFIYRNICTVI